MTPTYSHDTADPIDRLLGLTGGDVLAPPPANLPRSAGEYDAYRLMSRRDIRRLTAGGFLSSEHGLQPDVLAHMAKSDLSADDFVAWYCDEALRGMDWRATARQGTTWETRDRSIDLPSTVVDYLARLVFPDKADYAAEYAYAAWGGWPMPTDPGTGWACKARAKIDALLDRHTR